MDEKNDYDNLGHQTKRAMATAALITTIFKEHLDGHKCPLMEDDDDFESFTSELLDHVIIVGGFPRDILLNRNINDIDIVINLRELCKLQSNHLNKYHSKKDVQSNPSNSSCIYWDQYTQKLSNNKINEDQTQNAEMVAMHNFNYILNGKFWINILKNHKLLINKLSVKDDPSEGYMSCKIVNSVDYGNVNLDEQRIDLVDTFHPDKCFNDEQDHDAFAQFHRKNRQLSISGLNIKKSEHETLINQHDANQKQGGSGLQLNKSREEVDHSQGSDSNNQSEQPQQTPARRKGRLQSMALIDFDIDNMGDDFGTFGFNNDDNTNDTNDKELNGTRPEYVTIEVPIYSGKVRYKLLYYDFSINTSIIPLSNIIKLKDLNNDNNNNENDQPLTWIDIIENGLGECDAIEDCTINKVLKTPEREREDGTIQAHPMTYHFWRIVRWMIREPGFKLDDSLIAAHGKDYERWLIKKYLKHSKNSHNFMAKLGFTLKKECKSVQDVKQMLSTLALLKFNEPFIALMEELPALKHELIDTLGGLKNENFDKTKLTELFNEFDYPIEEQLFAVSNPMVEKIEILNNNKVFLEEQLKNKNERIQDLERQNDRLLKEVKMLNELNQKNDKVKDLENDNTNLMNQLQELNDSKMTLAVNANKTIDQLRTFLFKYQQALIATTDEAQVDQ